MADYSAAGLEFPNVAVDGDTYTNTLTSTTYTYAALEDRWTGPVQISSDNYAEPTPSQVTAVPAFVSGSGTEEDPFICSDSVCGTQGTSIKSDQVIVITGQTPGYKIAWTSIGTNSGTRFVQPEYATNNDGEYGRKLFYNDEPATAVNGTTYIGKLKVGTVYVQWTVVQQVTDELTKGIDTTITVFGGKWQNGAVVTMFPGTVVGGQPPYFYTYSWQRSNDNYDWLPIPGENNLTYTLTTDDSNHYIRGVTTGTDFTTPIPQSVTIPSKPSSTRIAGPVDIKQVYIIDNEVSPDRFNSQSFNTFVDYNFAGTGGNTRQLKIKLQNGDNVWWGVFNSAGQLSDLTTEEPSFVTMNNQMGMTVLFPRQFYPSGYTPDEELPEGTTIQSIVRANNAYGSAIAESIAITPEAQKVISYPKPSLVKGFVQYPYYFQPTQTPFNFPVPSGTYQAIYSFNWAVQSVTITFDPVWEQSIKYVQAGGRIADTVTLEYTDEAGNVTTNSFESVEQFAAPQAITPPAKIASIKISTDNDTDPTVGLINFQDINYAPVLYNPLTEGYLNSQKLTNYEATDKHSTLETRQVASEQNNVSFDEFLRTGTAGTYTNDAYIHPSVKYSNGFFFLNLAETTGTIDVTMVVNYTDGTSSTFVATGLNSYQSHNDFVTTLVNNFNQQYSHYYKVTPSVADNILKLTAATGYTMNNVTFSIVDSGYTSTNTIQL